jgi:hypothetical protein
LAIAKKKFRDLQLQRMLGTVNLSFTDCVSAAIKPSSRKKLRTVSATAKKTSAQPEIEKWYCSSDS